MLRANMGYRVGPCLKVTHIGKRGRAKVSHNLFFEFYYFAQLLSMCVCVCINSVVVLVLLLVCFRRLDLNLQMEKNFPESHGMMES